MYNTGYYVQSMPKSVSIQKDYYDIHEKKIICISNASWEILDRTFFSRISRYNGGEQVTMVTEKRISRMKRTFFIDNVKNMFVLSLLQTVSGTSTPIKIYCTF